MTEDNPMLAVVRRYGPPAGEKGPELFVRELLKANPDPWQLEVLRRYGRRERRISIASCHGPGKTAVAAWCIVHQLLVRFPQKTACTAPTAPQLFDALYAEVKTWLKRLPPVLLDQFDVKSDRIELKAAREESFLTARTARADQPEALQGIHSEWVLLVVDEASGVPEPIFEAAAGSMSGHSATTLLLSNPVRTSGFFFDTQHKLAHMWKPMRICAAPAVPPEYREEGVFYSDRVSLDFCEDIKARYGEESNAYRVRVLGLFPRSDLDTIIPYELALMATQRDVKPIMPGTAKPVWGLDVARFGDDETCLVKRVKHVVTEPPRRWRHLDTMQVAGVVKAEWDSTPVSERPLSICVDAIGLGAGVADRLRELGLPARDINVSESPALSQQYRNLRTELWFKGKEWFARRNCSIPNDEDLVSELVATKYQVIDSSGRLAAESKKDMKKRGLKSPNVADAFLLTLAEDASAALYGSQQGTTWNQPLRRNVKGIV